MDFEKHDAWGVPRDNTSLVDYWKERGKRDLLDALGDELEEDISPAELVGKLSKWYDEEKAKNLERLDYFRQDNQGGKT